MFKNTAILTLLVLLIIPCFASAAFKLPDTGQNTCYDTSKNVIDCADTGQDGAYSINPMSYTDNGNGTVSDNNTGLIWQQRDDGNTYDRYQAAEVCTALNLGGYTDWRLPTKKELMSLTDYGIPAPGPAIISAYFPNTASTFYWSSTVTSYVSIYFWAAGFNDGEIGVYWGSAYRYNVRCVRGGQYLQPGFTDNGNGTVMEKNTGLMWQQGEPGVMAWGNAISYCAGLSLGGYSDWRLPNIRELESITDETRYMPAIDTTFFPTVQIVNPLEYWSSTTIVGNPNFAWAVNVGNSSVDPILPITNKLNGENVRCVRGGLPSSVTLDELNTLFPLNWQNYTSGSAESIYSVIMNCINDRSYTSPYAPAGLCHFILENISYHDLPVIHYSGQSFLSPWVDGTWDNLIPNSPSKFNTVYRGTPGSNEKFEVISRVDLANSPYDGTDNVHSYFFTYTAKDDQGRTATTMNEWIDYLGSIKAEYGRPIDILTIYSHGAPGKVLMSDAFQFQSDLQTRLAMNRLRDEGILSPCSTILLFSCQVGQDPQFVQNLADWSGATVYANTVFTGPYVPPICTSGGCKMGQDWSLDVVRSPAGSAQCVDNLQAPLRAASDMDFMFPGGFRVQIPANTVTADGQITVTNALTHLTDLGVDTNGPLILSAFNISLVGTLIGDQMNIQITFPLGGDLAGLTANDIKLCYWDGVLHKWSTSGITDVNVDIINHSVTFKTSHTTIFAALVNKLRFTGFLAPIGGADATGGLATDPVRAFKLKSTVPMKMLLTSWGGIPVSVGTHTLQLFKVSNGTTSDMAIDATPTDAASTGNAFRLIDATTGEWQFNLATAPLSKGIYEMKVTLSDGTAHVAFVELK